MNTAQKRREQELRELMKEGVLSIKKVSRWHFRVGTLHIWPASERWEDEGTGHRGRLSSRPIRQLLLEQTVDSDSKLPPRASFFSHIEYDEASEA